MTWSKQSKNTSTWTNKEKSSSVIGGFGYAKFGLSIFGQTHLDYSNQTKH